MLVVESTLLVDFSTHTQLGLFAPTDAYRTAGCVCLETKHHT